MKKLYTFHLWEGPQAGMYKELLAQEGIDCLLRNEQLASALGEIPFGECYPELWIIDEEVFPRARLLLDRWLQERTGREETWSCPHCGELIEGHFTVCWSCGAPQR